MHPPTESVFPESSTPAIVGSNSLNGTSKFSSVQQLPLDWQSEALANRTINAKAAKIAHPKSTRNCSFDPVQTQKQKQFEGDGAGFDILTQQSTEPVVRQNSRWQLAEKGDAARNQRKLQDDGDPLTGAYKDKHLVGKTDHGLGTDHSLNRTVKATAPPFSGRLMKYSSGHHMMQGEDVRRWQTQMRSRGWSIDVDGVYGPKSAQVCRSFQQEKHLQVDGIVGSQTWSSAWTTLTGSGSSPPAPSGASGSAIAQLARAIAEGKYNGENRPQYVFGAENDPFSPSSVKRTDCSEFVQVVVSSTLKKQFVDGSWNQYAACQKISVAQALRTPGALLFIADGGRVHHVEVSLGNGSTAAARSTRSGVGVFQGNIGFTSGGLIPDIKYS